MKISAISYPVVTTRSGHTSFRVWPDSCLILSDRPVYVPGFAPEFRAIPALGVRLTRIGKCVVTKFASRYYTEWTAALIIEPRDPMEPGSRHIFPTVFDNSVIIGQWQPIADVPLPEELIICNSCVDDQSTETIPTPANYHFNDAVAVLSTYNTIKMGDIILLPLHTAGFRIKEGLRTRITDPAGNPLLRTPFK